MNDKWEICMGKKILAGTKIFTIGSVGYSLIEILWRGFTHWTMAVTGGICFLAVYFLNLKYRKKPLVEKCFMCSVVITAVEFLVGCIVNLVLKWDVWNYSKMHFNLLGQICLLYSFLWFLLSFPLCWFSGKLRKKIQQ